MIDFLKDKSKTDYLAQQSRKRAKYKWNYLDIQDFPKDVNVQFLLSHVFKGNKDLYKANVYCSGYYRSIIDTKKDFVWVPRFAKKMKGFSDLIVDEQIFNKMVVVLERAEDGEPVYRHVSAECHLKVWEDDLLFFTFKNLDSNTFWFSQDSNDYTLIQRYFKEGEFQFIESKLYKGFNSNFQMSQQVSLETFHHTKNIKPLINTGYSKTIFVDEIDCPSKVDNLCKAISNIDLLKNVINNDLIGNMEMYTIINGCMNKESLEATNSEKKLWNTDPNTPISVEFVKNENKLIETAIKYIEDIEIPNLAFNAPVPIESISKVSANWISEGSRDQINARVSSDVIGIRNRIDCLFDDIFDVLENESGFERPEIVWWEVFKKDNAKILEEIEHEQKLGLIDPIGAVQKWRRLDSREEAEEFFNNFLKLTNDTNATVPWSV